MIPFHYEHGITGLQQDRTKAMELYARAADLGCYKAHCYLGNMYYEGRSLKKAKFHYEAAALAGHEVARFIIGRLEAKSGNMDQAVKHWNIAASAGCYISIHQLITSFKRGHIIRDAINLTLKAYNNACAEMRSDARDAYIRKYN
jgi:TPR repeat protein